MKSRPPALEQAAPMAPARRRWWTSLARTAFGLALLAALVFWGQIDLRALLQLRAAPSAVVTCLGLLCLSLVLAALRWSILLRAFGVSIPFVNVFHFVAIGLMANVLLLGMAGGDAIRGIYAWRALGRGGGRVAVSVLADRLFALFAVLFISLAFSLLYWHRMQQVPALAALGISIIAAATACVIGTCILFAAPKLMPALEAVFSRWRLMANLFGQVRGLILVLQTNPRSLLSAFALALATQILAVLGVLVLAEAINIGELRGADYILAVPLTLVVNALPLTPSGIGVGEAAFDQICRWLESTPSGAAYSSIFFAFRVVSTLLCIPGLVSLAFYRYTVRCAPATSCCDSTESDFPPTFSIRSSTER
jgi:glycosyltransferase 2 family protein